MNHNLRRQIIRHKVLLLLINWLYRLKNKKLFNSAVQTRANSDIFNTDRLIEHIPYSPTDIVIDNNIYGLSYCLKQFAGIDTRLGLNATIEHGLFLGNLVREDDFLYPVKSIVSFGNRRRKHLIDGGINKDIVLVGPYIHYAKSLLSDQEFKDIKNQLGKVLLVFPSHGIIGVNTSFENDGFIREIERVRQDFDTVLVSMYWTDFAKKDLIAQYRDMGYKIVSSGHRFDLNFLARQRSLIQLADYTMSNKVGTHVGYCIYLNKPHYIYQQKVELMAANKKIEKHLKSARNEAQEISCQQEIEEITSYFTKDLRIISDEQRTIVDEFWGVSQIKSPEDLIKIFS